MKKTTNTSFLTVSYRNDFNNVINKENGVTDSNLMYGILGLIKNSTENELNLSYEYVRSLSGRYAQEKNDRTYDFLKKWVKKMDNTIMIEESDEKGRPFMFTGFPLFTLTKNDKVGGNFKIKVNDEFDVQTILRELDSNYTTFDFKTYVALESKYSKALYRLLLQWRGTEVYKIKMEKFRVLMCVPETMSNKKFMYSIVNPAIKEINEKSILISELSVSKKVIAHGEIDTLTFFFKVQEKDFKKRIAQEKEKVALPTPKDSSKNGAYILTQEEKEELENLN